MKNGDPSGPMTYLEASQGVKKKRKIICPNGGFVNQLVGFEVELKREHKNII
jgi:hypothetical protein